MEGRTFHVVTDHELLIYVMSSQPNQHTPQQIHHLDFISQFTTDIQHFAGENNPVSDTLSRLNAIHFNNCPPVSFQEMAEEQRHNPELVQLQQTSTSMTLQAIPLQTAKDTISCDVSTGVSRPFVPRKF